MLSPNIDYEDPNCIGTGERFWKFLRVKAMGRKTNEHTSLADVFSRPPNRDFVESTRLAAGACLVVADKPPGFYPHPPSAELVLVLNAGRRPAPFQLDAGFGRIERTFVPGAVTFGPPTAAYDVDVDVRHRILCLAIPAPLIEASTQGSSQELADRLEPLLQNDIRCADITHGMRSIWRESIQDDLPARLFIEGLSMSLLGRLLRLAEVRTDCASPALSVEEKRRIVEAIEDELGDDLSLNALAAKCDRSPSEWNAAFRASFLRTPYQYVLERRVARARLFLETGNMPLADVAVACGFYDQAHLTNVFKKHVGVTPARYRKHLGSSSV